MKHTPGPWKVTGPFYSHRGANGYHILNGVEHIAFNITEKADALLIAAAPEMYEALERAYVFMLLSDPPHRNTANGQSDLCTVRDILALVRGEDIEETQCEFEARAVLEKIDS